MKAKQPGTIGRPQDEGLTDRILAATVQLVLDGGYAALSMEAVAQVAGCGRPAIYRRFSGKDELVAAAAATVLHLGPLPDHGNLEDDLIDHVLYSRDYQNQPRLIRAGVVQGLPAIFEPGVFALLWDRLLSKRRDQGVEIIERGIARGEIDPLVDPDVVLDLLAGLTLYRQSIKRIDVPEQQYRTAIQALIAHPPLMVTP
ncbi:TetR family transcriptional regulator [Branchiibius hedensis]|uniref:DNA-binding transcriptional regulator, AcrR family n=1 Tax=Branchiibius hedensis TaxID=672460 RepID=A0A2Y9C2E9_9MICO|nr:TetR/AcrR family transcriptional regulator [Branchiibius hedensis]PWJ27162.1 TetR family transcriptional regulator [Branchiibius hedensis]SSA35973.1 DNA-binding transcriptional regulator, AcrR family [Branchiibius hedensis]